jgi:hypothetical protein
MASLQSVRVRGDTKGEGNAELEMARMSYGTKATTETSARKARPEGVQRLRLAFLIIDYADCHEPHTCYKERNKGRMW